MFIEKILPKIAESTGITMFSIIHLLCFSEFTHFCFHFCGFWCMLVVETNNFLKGVVNMTKNDWIRKLTSRKFWLAVAGFVSMLVIYCTGDNSKAESISALIMAGASVVGYLIGEGLADSKPVSVDPGDDEGV